MGGCHSGRDDIASGRFVEGLHIPINVVRFIADQLIATGKVSRPYLGVLVASVMPSDARTSGLAAMYGAQVQSLEHGTAAARSGTRAGDIITAIDGIAMSGQPITLDVTGRVGQRRTVTMTIDERPNDEDAYIRLAFQ